LKIKLANIKRWSKQHWSRNIRNKNFRDKLLVQCEQFLSVIGYKVLFLLLSKYLE